MYLPPLSRLLPASVIMIGMSGFSSSICSMRLLYPPGLRLGGPSSVANASLSLSSRTALLRKAGSSSSLLPDVGVWGASKGRSGAMTVSGAAQR